MTRKVLLISPMEGVVGGMSVWTRHVMGYFNSVASSGVSLQLFDYHRTNTGRLIGNALLRIWRALTDYARLTRNACRTIASFDGDAVHICTSAGVLLIKDIVLLRCARKRGLKSFVHFHFGRIPDLAARHGWEWWLLGRVIHMADVVVVMDGLSCETLKNSGYTSVELLPNPLAPSVVALADEMSDIEREEGRLFFAGHCIPTKGVFELVRSCATLKEKGVKLKLVMAGAIGDGVRSELVSLASHYNSGNASWFEIIGQISPEEILREMKRCSVFVLPTYTEGFPNVILESMACGCPIIASAVGAIPEMLDGGACGVLVKPRDEIDLREAIQSLMSDSARRQTLGETAALRVAKEYSIGQVCGRLSSIWTNSLITEE